MSNTSGEKPAYAVKLTWDSRNQRWKKKHRGAQFYPTTRGLKLSKKDYLQALSEIEEQIEQADKQADTEKPFAADYMRAIEIREEIRAACVREIAELESRDERGNIFDAPFIAADLNKQFRGALEATDDPTDTDKPPLAEDHRFDIEYATDFYHSLSSRMERELTQLSRWWQSAKPRELTVDCLPVVPLLSLSDDPEEQQLVRKLRSSLKLWLNWTEPANVSDTVSAKTTAFLSHLRLRAMEKAVGEHKLSPTRFAVISSHLKTHFVPSLGSRGVRTLKEDDLTTFKQTIAEKKVTNGSRQLSPKTQNDILAAVKLFLRWLYEEGYVEHELRNISRFHVKLPPPKPKPLTVDKAKEVITLADGRLRLWLLLMLNCGMTQKDLSDLLITEVDYSAGRICRKRSKTKYAENTPTVQYPLWNETFQLLCTYKPSTGRHALLTEEGQTLQRKTLSDTADKAANIDRVRSRFRTLVKNNLVLTGITLKQLRSTSATTLEKKDEFSRYSQFFLAHAPTSVADRHYVIPDQERFDAAVKWLGEQFGYVTHR